MTSKDFLKKDRFLDYLKATKMYKEILLSKEGAISLCFSIITCIYFFYLQKSIPSNELCNALFAILGIIISGGFGLLGFLVGGLGILIGSISDNMISLIDKNDKFVPLLGIIFRFYYDGTILAALIVICVIDYAFLLIPSALNVLLFSFMSIVTSYLFLYALLVSVMLLGTSIRLLLLRHSIYVKLNSKDKKK